MPAPALPAALAAGRIDAATLIHAQAFKALQTGEFVAVTQTAADLTKKFGVRMVSAVLAGYGEKLDAKVTNIDNANRRVTLSIKALEIEDEKQAMADFGSSDSGASLGDILGPAIKERQEQQEQNQDSTS